MRVANKLTPKTKSKMTETKLGHRPGQFQDKTLQLLVPNSKRLGGYTGDTQEHKVCQDNDLNQVVYTAQMKARQALDRSRKFVKTMIYIHRAICTTQMKAKTNNYSEKILITWTTHLKNKQGKGIQAKKT